MLLCNKCCIRGPNAPNKCGGKPLASNRACKRPTSESSLSLSTPGPDGPPEAIAWDASCGEGGSSVAEI